MKSHKSRPKEWDDKDTEGGIAFAPSHAPEESSLHVERLETPESRPKQAGDKSARAGRKARKTATNKSECGHHRLDESSECDDETGIQVGAYGIAGPQLVNHLIEDDQPPQHESNLVNGDVNPRSMLVEADLAPEVTLAEEVNIQEEEKLILKKGQYKRVLFFAMVFYGLAIIGCITTFILLFTNRPQLLEEEYGELSQFKPLISGLIAAILHFVATFVILIPRMRCRRASTRLEEYAPNDIQLLRDAQIVSTVSLLFSSAALAMLFSLTNLRWLGYAFMTLFVAGTVFASSRVHLLRRPNETRHKIPLFVWVLFVLFFLGLTGITIWYSLNPVYPDCKVQYPSWIGDGYCDGKPYSSEACGYDGGDCVKNLGDYPGCIVKDPFRIADGICDGGAYNTTACGHDGGDCVVEKEASIGNEEYPNCIVPFPFWIGNGICNGQVYGTVECGFDGGDCLQPGEPCRGDKDCASEFCNSVTKVCDSAFASDLYPNCYVDKPNWIGDGECDGGYYAREACGFDGGDCLQLGRPCLQDEECASGLCNADTKVCYLGVLENYPDCIVDFPRRIGDGECDGGEYAREVCGHDGGDC